MFVPNVCLSQIYTIKMFSSAFSSSHWCLAVKWFSYPVCFGWLPGCCLSCTACRVLLCRSEWSIFPRADAGTSYKMSLLHTLSLEGFPAPRRPKWKQLQTFSEVPLHDTQDMVWHVPTQPWKPWKFVNFEGWKTIFYLNFFFLHDVSKYTQLYCLHVSVLQFSAITITTQLRSVHIQASLS